jgi:predicted O-linked N-acetylglucosamine transferase (SPINDLY family)
MNIDDALARAVHDHEQGRPGDAVPWYRRALAIEPAHAEILYLHALASAQLNTLPAGLNGFGRAICLQRDRSDLYGCRGNVWQMLDRAAPAMADYRRSLVLEPSRLGTWRDLAALFWQQRHVDAAAECYRHVVGLVPDFGEGYRNLTACLYEAGQAELALASARLGLKRAPDSLTHTSYIYMQDFDPNADWRSQQEERKRWAQLYATLATPRKTEYRNSPDPERRLRIGFVSPNFGGGTAMLIKSLIEFGNPHLCSWYAYSGDEPRNDLAAFIRNRVEGWRVVSALSDEALSAQIGADGIDILVEMANHIGGHRLTAFASKPAPIQVCAWGHSFGSGMSAMDYVIIDPIMVPPEKVRHFTEQVLYLPCTLAFAPPEMSPEVAESPSFKNEFVTFGHLGRLAKVTDRTMVAWVQILDQIANSRLLLRCDRILDCSGKRRLERMLMNSDIDQDRIGFLPPTDRWGNLSDYSCVDVALDPMPATGGITTWESLWMGVPLVTLLGRTPNSRTSSSLLVTVELESLVTHSTEEYVATAVRLACDHDFRRNLRQELRARVLNSPALKVLDHAERIQNLFRAIWRSWCVRKSSA